MYVRSGQQDYKIIASDGAAGDRFGWSVALSGAFALVGAPYDEEDGFGTGAVYVFDLSNGQELYKLISPFPDGTDYFGISIAIDGNRAVIGADGVDHFGTASGAAYVFDLTDGSLLHTLVPIGGATQDHFGFDVDLDGDHVIVGAHGDGSAIMNYGAAYIFDLKTGAELHKLVASDPGDDDQFGYAVAIDGDRALIGAWRDDDHGSDSGSAYLFDVSDGQELQKFTASNATGTDYFGLSVDISTPYVAIGAPLVGVGGGAYVFDLDTGKESHMLLASDAQPGAWNGQSIAIDGERVLSGAYFDNEQANHAGAAFLFETSVCAGDLNGDGSVNFFDVSAFLNAFSDGCS